MRTPSIWMCGMIVAVAAAAVATAPRSAFAAGPAASAAPAASSAQPSQIVQNVAQRFLQDLDAHRAEYGRSPQALRAAVDRDVLPY
ncbi:MAG: hypothetical protein ACREUG_07180, partial [Steroidobacteraceae bacterium]